MRHQKSQRQVMPIGRPPGGGQVKRQRFLSQVHKTE
jgi:hypothetical protein